MVRGTVAHSSDGALAPLPYALVEVRDPYGPRAVLADSLGRYEIRGLTPGRRTMRAGQIGYHDLVLEVLVPGRDAVIVDMELRARPIPIPPVMVWLEPTPSLVGAEPLLGAEFAEVELRALEVTTGMAEVGIQQAARQIPGSGSSDPTDVLFMRGSTQDLKLVLLDGAPVYAPFHTAGLLPPFDPATLGGAELYLGGAPARYDGGLSYILDLETRAPRRDRVRGTGALDLMNARVALEGPVGEGTGFLASGRALHRIEPFMLGQGKPPYGYFDALGRIGTDLGEGRQLRLTGFWNQESVDLDLPATGDPSPMTSEDARWGNAAVSLAFHRQKDLSTATLNAAFSSYTARLPLSGIDPIFARGDSRRARLIGDVTRVTGGGLFRFGASLDWLGQRLSARSLAGDASGVVESRADASVAGAYAEGEWLASGNLKVRGGLRMDHFSAVSSLKLSPRVSVTWLLTESAALTLAGGRYHQYAPVGEERVEEALDAELSSEARQPLLQVASASHLVLSLDQALDAGLRLGLEGFAKRFEGVGGAGPGTRVNASGLDLRVVREASGWTGWLGYSLTWFWEGGGATSRFAGQHLLSSGLTGRFREWLGLDLRVSFGDGLPYTSVPIGENLTTEAAVPPSLHPDGGEDRPGTALLEGGPDDQFLRVDAEAYGVFRRELGGRPVQLRPYLRLLNALDRRDALFYYFEPWRGDEARPLAQIPVLPVLGLEWRF